MEASGEVLVSPLALFVHAALRAGAVSICTILRTQSTGRKGDELVLRGLLQVDGETVASFDATIKRVGGAPKPSL